MQLPAKHYPAALLESAHLWLPAIIICLIYFPALENGFVWDDHKAFIQYPYYRDISYLWRAFTEPLVFLSDYYRPVTSSTYILQNHLLGLNPVYLHATSLAIHIANTVLVSILCRTLVRHWQNKDEARYLPLIAGLVYALHPALIESVAWISGRYDQLVTFFLLSAVIADRTISHGLRRSLAVGILFLFAALSKEMAVALAPVLPALHLASAREQSLNPRRWVITLSQRPNLYVYLSILIAGMAYLAIRYKALGHLVSTAPASGTSDMSPLSHLLLVSRSLTEYLQLIALPFNQLSPAHPVEIPLSPVNLANWLPVIGVVIILSGLLIMMRRLPRTSWMFLALAGSLAPVLNFIPLTKPASAYFSEVYLVFPVAVAVVTSCVACLEIKQEFPRLSYRHRNTAGILFLVLWLTGSLVTVHTTVPIWKSDHSLWLWASIKHPESAAARINLSSALYLKGEFEMALAEANRATELEPVNPYSWIGKGRALMKLDRLNEAAEAMEKAVTLGKGRADLWVNLAIVRMEQGHLDIARDILLEAALPQEPNDINALFNLATIYARKKDNRRALYYFLETRKRAGAPEMIRIIDDQIEALDLKQVK